MTDLTVYQPPGVYVQDETLPFANILNPVLGEQVLCLVGPAVGYQSATETITLHSATPTALSNPGVNQSSLVVTTLTGITLVAGTDYAASTDSSNPDAVITSLTRLPADPATASPGGLADGGAVRVTYGYTDSSYYQPQLFSDYGSLVNTYGAPTDTTGSATTIVSPLSLAAKCAFENGASQIICIAVDGGAAPTAATWQTGFVNAYATVATNSSVGVIVPVFPAVCANSGATLNPMVTDLRTHVDKAYANGFPRIAIVSGDSSFDTTATPFETVAQAASDRRVVAVYPTRYLTTVSTTSQKIEVGGCYAAAALGGRLMLNPVDRGLTRQVLNTLSDIPPSVQQGMSKPFMDHLAQNGVLVIMTSRSGQLVVRHGLTTKTGSPVDAEISYVRAGDRLLVDVQQALENSGLIGSPITGETTTSVKSILVSALEQEVSNQVILTYANVQVTQETLPSGNPTVIDCTFSYKPAAPLNYITVAFTLDLSQGGIVPATTDTTSGTASTTAAATI